MIKLAVFSVLIAAASAGYLAYGPGYGHAIAPLTPLIAPPPATSYSHSYRTVHKPVLAIKAYAPVAYGYSHLGHGYSHVYPAYQPIHYKYGLSHGLYGYH